MDLTLPVLVSVDRRDIFTAQIPGVSDLKSFTGPSIARLLDDLAMHLMEEVPKMTPDVAAQLAFSPYVELRRVKVEVPLGKGREETIWKGRLTVVLDRWPKEKFLIATVMHLPAPQFAIGSTAALTEGLRRFIGQWGEKRTAVADYLDRASARPHEYLELLTVDVDLPTILPSRPKKTRKKRSTANKDKTKKKPAKAYKRELVPPRTLSQVSENLTHRSLDGRLDRAFYRDQLIESIMRHLEREGAAILLVGASGVGKSAIVHEVVRRLADKSTSLTDRRDVWQVDGNRIIAGMSIVGAWEHRVTEMVNELNARQDILFVNDLPALVYTGRSAHSDTNVAEFLEPHLGRGEIRIVGECTPERLAVLQDEAPGFFARFRVVQVPEMSEEDALHVLLHVVRRLDEDQPLAVDPAALEAAVALTRRFRALDVFPGKAVDLLTRAISDRSEVVRDSFNRRKIQRSTVIQHFARQAGLPEFLLLGRGGPSTRQIRKFFEHRIVGQPEAIDNAVDIITTVSQALNDPERPIATLLFVGPTGVGKTETAKAVAEYLFGSKHRMLRFDMSEFQYPDAVSRLIGDRFRPDGDLTRRIQQQPFSLVLLDEIEKAHPAIFDSLLQVLGEGRLTNASGRTVNFTSTVIVMTSNLGVRDAEKAIGFSQSSVASLSAHYRGAAEKFFRPEFFNRIDRVVAFSPLDRDVIIPLVGRLLAQMLARQGLKRSSVLVNVDPELVEVLVEQGFDRRYGARSVKRILEQRLAVPLSHHLVEDHGADLRLVEVFPRRGDLGMELQVPSRIAAPPIKGAAAPRNWKQVEARHAALRLALDALTESESLARHQSEHGKLLAALNDGALTEAGQSRLLAISTVQEQLTELVGTLDAFESTFLELEQFVVEHKTELVRHKDYGTKQAPVDQVRAQRVIRAPLRGDVLGRLENLELELARVDHQLRGLDRHHDDQLLIRFTTGNPEPLFYSVRTWLCAWGQRADADLLEALPSKDPEPQFYRPWGAVVQVFVRRRTEWRELGQANVWDISSPNEDIDGAALSIRGRNLRTLMAPELGLWVWQHEVGPDYHLDIVRIEDVGHDGDPVERLSALDASHEAMQKARREGQVEGALAENAPIVRWFENYLHTCRETGVSHDRTSNSYFLQKIVLRRLHAAMISRILAEVKSQ